jgi:hypothetical protein
MVKPPLRYEISIQDINELNIEIEIRERLIESYLSIQEKIGEYDYIAERIIHLTNEMCEYMIARIWAVEGAKTFGDDFDIYREIEKEFRKNFPNLEFHRPKNRETNL